MGMGHRFSSYSGVSESSSAVESQSGDEQAAEGVTATP